MNTVWWEFRNIDTQPGEINYRKSKDIAFVVNAGVNIISNNFDIEIKIEVPRDVWNSKRP